MQIIQAQYQPLSEINGEEALIRIQRIAKTCYMTYKDTDDMESAKRIVKMLMDSGHTSLLEHYMITMNYVSNIASYKDLTRHRLASPHVASTRYVNYSKKKFNNEIAFLDPIEISDKQSVKYDIWKSQMLSAENAYMKMAKEGATPDELSLMLPQSTAAEFNISANLREWRHILGLRSAAAFTGKARPCVMEIMNPTLELFHSKIPVVFDDIYEAYKQKTR